MYWRNPSGSYTIFSRRTDLARKVCGRGFSLCQPFLPLSLLFPPFPPFGFELRCEFPDEAVSSSASSAWFPEYWDGFFFSYAFRKYIVLKQQPALLNFWWLDTHRILPAFASPEQRKKVYSELWHIYSSICPPYYPQGLPTGITPSSHG